MHLLALPASDSRLRAKFAHYAQDLLIRLDDARGLEVRANSAEHVAALGVKRANRESVRIGPPRPSP